MMTILLVAIDATLFYIALTRKHRWAMLVWMVCVTAGNYAIRPGTVDLVFLCLFGGMLLNEVVHLHKAVPRLPREGRC